MISKKKLLSTGPSKSIGSSRITYAESPNSSISNPNLLNKSLLSSTISFSGLHRPAAHGLHADQLSKYCFHVQRASMFEKFVL